MKKHSSQHGGDPLCEQIQTEYEPETDCSDLSVDRIIAEFSADGNNKNDDSEQDITDYIRSVNMPDLPDDSSLAELYELIGEKSPVNHQTDNDSAQTECADDDGYAKDGTPIRENHEGTADNNIDRDSDASHVPQSDNEIDNSEDLSDFNVREMIGAAVRETADAHPQSRYGGHSDEPLQSRCERSDEPLSFDGNQASDISGDININEDSDEDAPPSSGKRNVRLKFGADFSADSDDFDTTYSTADFYSGTISDTSAAQPRKKSKNRDVRNMPYDFSDFSRANYFTASEMCAKKAASFRIRSFFCLLLAALCAYLTIAPYYGIYVPPVISYVVHPYLSLGVLTAAQAFAMILSSDIIAAGLYRLFHLRPTLDSVAALSACAVLAHAVSIVAFPQWGGYLPYCAVGCAMLSTALRARCQKYTALRKKFKVVSTSESPYGVFLSKNEDGSICAFKQPAEKTEQIFDAMLEPDSTERFSLIFAPLVLCAIIIFSVLSSFAAGHAERFLCSLAAISCTALPFCVFISCSLPSKKSASLLCSRGAAVIKSDIPPALSKCRSAVIEDDDIFPAGTVAINGFKLVGTNNFERVFTYTAGALIAADTGLKTLFSDLLKQQMLSPADACSVIHYEGGISAKIGADSVLVGTSGFLIRMGVRVREGLEIKHGVFTAINSELMGIFALKYQSVPSTSLSFSLLTRRKIAPILAVRDFNLTPGMIEKRFKLRRGISDYPDINERVSLSEHLAEPLSIPCAVLPFSSIRPFAEALTVSRRTFKAIRSNIIFACVSSVIGIILLTFLMRNGEFAAAAPHNVLYYNLLWLIPTILSSGRASKN